MADEVFCDWTVKLIRQMFGSGKTWLKKLSSTDWRSVYNSGKPPVRLYGSEHKLINMLKSSEKSPVPDEFIVLNCDQLAHKENEKNKAVVLMKVVPSRGASGKEPRHVNFHVYWHSRDEADEDLVLGWRMEGPEGASTDHHFFHVQAIEGFEVEGATSKSKWIPVKFPTMPLMAETQFELAMASGVAMCGVSELGLMLRHDQRLNNHAKPYLKKMGKP
jgi:hypothetical protein